MCERSTESIAVLSPHLDDAVLSAWSALRGPGEVRVVNVCSGLPANGELSPWDRLTGAADSHARMLERLAEDRLALARAGREATGLDFPEAQYRHGPLDPTALRNALAETLRDVVQVWAPAGIGGHEDHVQIRDAALTLALNGDVELKLYADLPYAVKFGWPGWVSGQADDPHLVVGEWWRRFLPAGLELAPERHSLSAEDARHKLHALEAYRTQLPGLNGGPLELLRRPTIIGHEVSWSVRAGAS
jgi:LmbE family N-acetylglucosaminyl deacetylase